MICYLPSLEGSVKIYRYFSLSSSSHVTHGLPFVILCLDSKKGAGKAKGCPAVIQSSVNVFRILQSGKHAVVFKVFSWPPPVPHMEYKM